MKTKYLLMSLCLVGWLGIINQSSPPPKKDTAASSTEQKEQGKAIDGWVTDSKCGAKGAKTGAEACTKKCLAAGDSAVVVSDADQKVLRVDNPETLKGHEGHHVTVTGSVAGDSIHVDKVSEIACGTRFCQRGCKGHCGNKGGCDCKDQE